MATIAVPLRIVVAWRAIVSSLNLALPPDGKVIGDLGWRPASKPNSTSISASAASPATCLRSTSNSATLACPPRPLRPPPTLKNCAAEFARSLEDEINRLVSPAAAGHLDFEAVEMAVRRQALQLAGQAVQRRLNDDRSDHSGPRRNCACGGQASYRGRFAKTFRSVLGPLTLRRAYYRCADCGTGTGRDTQAGQGVGLPAQI